jgi:ubiquinone/menaquinone biosynthesis C-methylase UbiE
MGHITADQYLAGVVGLSLVRSWYEDADRNAQRMRELAEIVARSDEFPYSMRLDPRERDVETAYAEWADTYDGPNPLIEVDEAVVRPLLDRLVDDEMTVLDAACGTGRQAGYLAGIGCSVVGVDRSSAMLDIARDKWPAVRFELGDIEGLPFGDDEFDLAIVSLALCHLPDPGAAVTELARVVRPGGVLVITDPHPDGSLVGGQAFYGGISPDRPMTWVRNHRHRASTWLRAFRAADLVVEDCIEEPFSDGQIASSPASLVYPDAASQAMRDLAGLWVWVLRTPREVREEGRAAH